MVCVNLRRLWFFAMYTDRLILVTITLICHQIFNNANAITAQYCLEGSLFNLQRLPVKAHIKPRHTDDALFNQSRVDSHPLWVTTGQQQQGSAQ